MKSQLPFDLIEPGGVSMLAVNATMMQAVLMASFPVTCPLVHQFSSYIFGLFAAMFGFS